MLTELFSGADGSIVYQGYVDDPRNTDNAWMETTAFWFHCSRELGPKLQLSAGDDAKQVRWLDVSDDNPESTPFLEPHPPSPSEALLHSARALPSAGTTTCTPRTRRGSTRCPRSQATRRAALLRPHDRIHHSRRLAPATQVAKSLAER